MDEKGSDEMKVLDPAQITLIEPHLSRRQAHGCVLDPFLETGALVVREDVISGKFNSAAGKPSRMLVYDLGY